MKTINKHRATDKSVRLIILVRQKKILASSPTTVPEMLVDISYAAPQAHKIINLALNREYSSGITFIFFPREEGSLSYLRLTHGVTPMSTTRLYRGYINWG
jgi:hypothetical protein